MIPYTLELQAFMPFKEKLEINFSAAEDDRIFLICGTTGSGKTSLFDALCFALYGVVSGSQRGEDTLKSQFASEDTESYVRFSFGLRGKTYLIHRTPRQMKLRRGGTSSIQNATAVLTFENGHTITKVSEVNEAVTDLLGLNADQFQKVVMLPQGEFRRFLSDDSRKKQEILRRIFGTGIYLEMEEQLKNQSHELGIVTASARTRMDSFASQLVADPDTPLYALLQEKQKDIAKILNLAGTMLKENQSRRGFLLEELERLRESLRIHDPEHAGEINSKFEALEKRRQSYSALLAQKSDIAKVRIKIRQLEQVREIQLLKSAYEETAKQHRHALSAKVEYLASLDKHEQQLKEETKKFNEEEQIAGRLPAMIREIHTMEQAAAKEEQKEDLLKQNVEYQAEAAALECSLRCWQLEQTMEETEQEAAALLLLKTRLSRVKTCRETCHTAKTRYEDAFRRFLSGQAYHLSLGLEEGAPCPVCGSDSHPAPAREEPSHITAQELEAIKLEYETASSGLSDSLSHFHAAWEEQGRPIPKADSPSSLLENQETMLNQLIQKTAVHTEETGAQLTSLKNEGVQVLPGCGRDDYLLRISETQTKHRINEEKIAQLQEELNSYPWKTASISSLIEARQSEITAHRIRYDALQVSCTDLNGQCGKYREAIRQSEKQAVLLSQQLTKQQAEYGAALDNAALGPDEFNCLVLQTDRLTALKEQVTLWEKQCEMTKTLISVYEKELEGCQRYDLEEIEKIYSQLNQKLTQQTEQLNELENTDILNGKMHQELTRTYEENLSLSKKYDEIHHLYQVAAGRIGERVSFERYVLGVYFDEVIESANRRLTAMTEGRYFLRRRTEREKGNTASGLELDIFDSYSGKYRHVNTMSGGESFQTALSLALGLGDIMTRNSGGVEINALFIDEGFGTLDEQALDSAVDSLFRLKESGKYIGIISHVRELRERIPVQLAVTQRKDGSTAAFL